VRPKLAIVVVVTIATLPYGASSGG